MIAHPILSLSDSLFLQLAQSDGLQEFTGTRWGGWIVGGLGLLATWLSWHLARWILDAVLHQWAKKTTSRWDDELLNKPFLNRLALFAPWLVLDAIGFILIPLNHWLYDVFSTSMDVLLWLNLLWVTFALVQGVEGVLLQSASLRDKPIKSYIQLVRFLIAVTVVLIIVATLSGKPIGVVLGGLGAVTALLVLVFRDALLGLTASIQLSSADLARIGDWVEIQKYGADGTVVEINLTTVKVQNWDMTFTVVPTYALISDSFKNWRGMMESPGRRIKRSIPLRLSSVRFADARLLGALDQVQLLAPWLADRKAAIALHNETLGVDASIEINGRRLTNLGLFRNYLEQYLRNHPGVNQDMPLIVRHLQPTSEGIPLEFYCFAKEKQWYEFEVLMADLMDHALAALPHFDLEAHEWKGPLVS